MKKNPLPSSGWSHFASFPCRSTHTHPTHTHPGHYKKWIPRSEKCQVYHFIKKVLFTECSLIEISQPGISLEGVPSPLKVWQRLASVEVNWVISDSTLKPISHLWDSAPVTPGPFVMATTQTALKETWTWAHNGALGFLATAHCDINRPTWVSVPTPFVTVTLANSCFLTHWSGRALC